MGFQPGQVGNPNGRPVGSRNRRTQEVLNLIQGRGDTDPLDALSEIVTTNKDPNIVATAANMLAPYVHSKRGTLSAPRFVPELIEVPSFTSIDQAEDFLNAIATRLGLSEIDSQSALELTTIVRTWIDSRRADQELQLKIASQGGGTDTTIRIEGGLPPLPGTNIDMGKEPALVAQAINGHASGPVIEHQPEQPTSEAQEP